MQVDLVHAETLFQRPHLGVFNRAAGPSCALRNAANLFAVLLLFTGCKHDLRISVDQLAEAEQVVETQPAPVDPQNLALAEIKPYHVTAGDILSIRLLGLTEDHYTPTMLELRVHEDGTIVPPIVGPVAVAGMTLNQAEQAIMAAHVPRVTNDLSVFVRLLEPETTTVLVLGSVSMPGLVRLRDNERNVLYAVAQAGGYGSAGTEGGFGHTLSSRVRVKPVDPSQPETVYDLADANDVRRALLAPPLASGDIVNVDADNSMIYVTGLVNAPGPVVIPPSSTLSVLRAIAAAGGLREYVDFKEATLIRELPDGNDAHVKLDLKGMLAGRLPDVALRGGDILYVPGNADTFVQEWFLRNMIPGPFNVSLHYDPLAQYNANRAIDQQGVSDNLAQAIRASLATSSPDAFVPPVTQP